MTSPNFEHLKAHILPLSVAKIFEAARQEWELVAVEISDEWDNCPCGQDIKEHCYIRNRYNGNTTYVGNVCINRFIQIDTGNLFDGLKRIAQDDSANANIDLIEHAYRMGYLYTEKPRQRSNFLRQNAENHAVRCPPARNPFRSAGSWRCPSLSGDPCAGRDPAGARVVTMRWLPAWTTIDCVMNRRDDYMLAGGMKITSSATIWRRFS